MARHKGPPVSEQGRSLKVSHDIGQLIDQVRRKNMWSVKDCVEEAVRQLAKAESVKGS